MRSSVWMSNQLVLNEFTVVEKLIMAFTLSVGLWSYL
jgi:hypothetical protein